MLRRLTPHTSIAQTKGAHLIRNGPVLGIHFLHIIYFRSADFLSSLIDIRFLKDLWGQHALFVSNPLGTAEDTTYRDFFHQGVIHLVYSLHGGAVLALQLHNA